MTPPFPTRRSSDLCRRADEYDRSILDIGQEAILLRPIEAVDLVDEEQRPLPRLPPPARAVEDLAQVGHSGKHGGQRLEMQVRLVRQEARDRRLAAEIGRAHV